MDNKKSYTDIEQSRKLTGILPPESADMYIGNYVGESGDVDGTNIHYCPKGESFGAPEIIEAWSLAALLNVLPRPSLHQTKDGKWYCDAELNRLYFSEHYFSEHYDNPIDACYELILKLHEQKLL